MRRRLRWITIGGLLLGLALAIGRCQEEPLRLKEEWGNLAGEWLFRTDPEEVGEREEWQEAEFREVGWRRIEVPGGWEEQGVTDARPGQPPKPKDGLPWTDYDGVAWYRLHFIVPKEWAGEDSLLALGSVDDQDRTYFNGHLVGETGPGLARAVLVHRRYIIGANLVRFGEENVLAVRVLDGGGPGGIPGPEVSLLPRRIAEAEMTLPQEDRPLKERFANPPAARRILKIIHSWPDAPEAQDDLIKTLLAQGFGGVVCNVSFDQYLRSEQKWQAFVRAVQASKKVGMSLWLYDEKGYPSGTAGGLTLEGHPEWEARGSLVAQADSEGGKVSLDLPPGKLVLVAAYPRRDGAILADTPTDLSTAVAEGRVQASLPAGQWRIVAITEDRLYEGTHASMSLADKLPYINLLMPEPTARFIELTHAAYAARLGEDLGAYFVATFTDEPSLMSMFMRAMPYGVLPWAPNLPAEFLKRRGYHLEPHLVKLACHAGGDEQKVRYDFWLTVGELVSENFCGQIQQFCRRHGVLSGGHLLCEESLALHVPLYGDFFRCLRRLDAPSIDCLTSIPSEVPWFIARMASSAAELEGNEITMCETSDFAQVYRPAGDNRPPRKVTEAEIRGTCNRLILSGINTITSYYTFGGISAAGLRRLNEWVGRCCTILKGGQQVADVALLYPIETLWPRFRPSRHNASDSPEAVQVEGVWRRAAESLYQAQRDFTYVDSRTLAEAAVREGCLTYKGLRWRVLILPAADTLPLAAWEKVASFWREGGVVIALDSRPTNSDTEFPSARVQQIGRMLFGVGDKPQVVTSAKGGAGVFLPKGADALLPVVLKNLLEADVQGAEKTPMRVTHRRIEGHEVYFLINDSAASCEVTVSLAVEGQGELYDPATGKISLLNSGEKVKLAFEPYGAWLLRFAKGRERKRYAPKAGELPGVQIEPLGAVAPKMAKGEFVDGELTEDAGEGEEGLTWRASATLTKTNVDTFLFLSFEYPQTVSLEGVEALVFDTWVPPGQATPAQLLVIVQDQDGADYLAPTGRALGAAGYCRVFVPLSSLQLAGWSKDEDGALDIRAMRAIRIGWGGYYGREGESIEFCTGAPLTARLGD